MKLIFYKMEFTEIFINVDPNIKKIFIYDGTKKIYEMTAAEVEEKYTKFVCKINKKYKVKQLDLYLLGNPGNVACKFKKSFKELFVRDLKSLNEQDNLVVVNCDPSIKLVTLTFPALLAEMLQIPTDIILADARKTVFMEKIKIMTDEEKKILGIKPELVPHVAFVEMTNKKIDDSVAEFFNNTAIEISVYSILVAKTLVVN